MTTKLNGIMEFGQVVRVDEDGTVTNAPRGLYAPELLDGVLSELGWSLMSYGYTGAEGQARSPIMHPSEYIGGRLARDILATPGYYVAIVSYVTPEDDDDDDDDDIDGWAVAYREETPSI